MSVASDAQITLILFTAFHMHYDDTGHTDMLSATIHMVQIRMSLYKRINLICVTPSSVGHSLRTAFQYIKAIEQWG